jgi:DNA-binding transcriptional regulator YdaS (Cro superfamily)
MKKPKAFLDDLKWIVKTLGGEAAAAARLGVSFYTVVRWLKGGGPSPIGRATVTIVAGALKEKKA